MKKNPWIVYLVGAILLAVLAWVVDTRVHFQWSVFLDQLQHVDWRRIVLGAAMVGFCYWLRAVRWAVLLKPQKKVSSFAGAGAAGDWLYRGSPLRPSGRSGASLPGGPENQALAELPGGGLHGRAHV